MNARRNSDDVVRLEDYRPSDFAIPQTRMTFILDPQATRVIADLSIRRTEGVDARQPLLLDGDGLSLMSVSINGKRLDADSFEATPDYLSLNSLPEENEFKVTIETSLSPTDNTQLMGLYLSRGVYCTQCEAEGFRRITYFLDRPDVLSVYTVRIEADKATAPVLLSNGNPTRHGDLPGGRHFAEWRDPHPKPSYLFALVAGHLGSIKDRFVTASGRDIALAIHVEHGKEARAAYAMDSLKRAMRWDEERFGREYDLDVFNIVAVSDFIIGAMENKGLNIFNDKFVLADDQTATDADFAAIEAIIAHEYFHNWTGNRITCRDWFQLCLKEGLTVYRDHEFSADQRSRAVKRIAEVRALRAQQFPEDQGPLAHPVRPRRYREINNFYTPTVYEKGSEIVRMIGILLGPEKFRAGMDLYFERHDGEAATVEDFLLAFEDAAGADLSQFALWYHQAGTPQVKVATNYDAASQTLTIDLQQSTPPTRSEGRKRLLHIPLAFELIGGNGHEMTYATSDQAVRDGVVHLRKRNQSVRLTEVSSEPLLSINRGFSAPISLSVDSQYRDRVREARLDNDPFNRWEALNDFAVESLVEATRDVRSERTPSFPPSLVSIYGELAADEALEPAFRGLALSVPGDAEIARRIAENIEPDAIHAARQLLLQRIQAENAETFERVYRSLPTGGPFSPDAESAGLRALRNALLELLSNDSGDPRLATAHYEKSTNMTDRLAALGVLAHNFAGSDAAQSALRNLETSYASDPLVMDKWFTVQATVPAPSALDRVRELTAHPTFSFGNPNRVRALIGAFSTANQVGFNRGDGAGYQFLAQTVVAIDEGNPRLAARLATALRAWRSLESGRRAKARQALSWIARQKSLSVNLADIVERTLN